MSSNLSQEKMDFPALIIQYLLSPVDVLPV